MIACLRVNTVCKYGKHQIHQLSQWILLLLKQSPFTLQFLESLKSFLFCLSLLGLDIFSLGSNKVLMAGLNLGMRFVTGHITNKIAELTP